MKRAKRYGIILAALLCAAVLAGCGSPAGEGGSGGGIFDKGLFWGGNREDGGKLSEEGTGFSDPKTDGEDAKDIVPEVQYEEFENLGNNPNNLYQTRYCPAFDETHIYWCEKGKVVQAKLDGSEARYIGEGDGFLNVYDGWLYTVTEGYIKERDRYKLEICRIDLETCEAEVLGTYAAGSGYVHPECLALLVANGFVFYSVHDGWSNQWVGMLDVQPEYIDDRPLRYLKDVETIPRNVEMSVGGDYLYVFIKSDSSNSYDREVWRENLSKPFTGDAWGQVVSNINGQVYGSWIFTKEGFHLYNGRDSEASYKTRLYDQIDMEEKTWYYSDELCKDTDDRFGTKAPRFLIGDILFLLEAGEGGADVYRYEHFDFQNGTYVTTAAVDALFTTNKTAIYGIHQDTLYLVELLENGSQVVRIKADGTVESSLTVPQ